MSPLPDPPRRRFPASALIVALIGCGISLWGFRTFQAHEEQRLQDQVRMMVNHRVTRLAAAVRSHNDFLNGFRLLMTLNGQLSAREFGAAAREALASYPHLSTLEWAPLVQPHELPQWQTRVREAGLPELIVKSRSGVGTWNPSPLTVPMLPIVYIEPFEPMARAYGYDLYDSLHPDEIILARDTGTITMSRRLPTLTVERVHGLIINVPVYEATATAAPGERRFTGIALAVLQLQRFLEQLNLGPDISPNDVLIVDHFLDGTTELIGQLHADRPEASIFDLPDPAIFDAPGSHTVRTVLPIWGRRWELLVRPTPAWLAQQRSHQPLAVLLLGLGVSLILGLYLYSRQRRTAAIEAQVRERTAELDASRAELQAILDNSPNVIFVKGLDGRYLVVNERFARLMERSVAGTVGRTPAEVFGPELGHQLAARDQEVLRTGETLLHEATTDAGGRVMTFLTVMFPLRDRHGDIFALGGIATDITARKHAEQEQRAVERRLMESQKLESLGVLAGGIAHDFNNLLTGIMGNAGLVALDLPEGSAHLPHLRQIERTAMRAAELCQQMLAYAGKGRFLVGEIDLSELVQDTLPLLQLSIKKQVRLHLHLAARLPRMLGDPTQMRQILMNLVINGSDAITAAEGHITITTGVVRADRALLRRASLNPELSEGDYVFLEVTDTGCGMSPETRSRIFDPFFTTKFAGRGLGLAAVHGIVRGHDGALFVDSDVGRGTTFRLLLPAAAGPTDAPAPTAADDSSWRAQGRVLLVDDEETVRAVAGDMLRALGLAVEVACDGEAALAAYDAAGGAFDLIVLDLTMPGIGGDEVLRRLRARQPDVRVLLISGFSHDDAAQRVREAPPTAFMQKPFSVGTLRRQLRALLPAPPRPTAPLASDPTKS